VTVGFDRQLNTALTARLRDHAAEASDFCVRRLQIDPQAMIVGVLVIPFDSGAGGYEL